MVSSVRAARAFPGAEAGSDWIVFGSSQGGNSALWTANLAADGARPAPQGGHGCRSAAELGSTVSAQWDKVAVWALGPAVLASWVPYYPDRDFLDTVSQEAQDQLPKLSAKCIVGDALTGLLNESLGRKFFTSNPLDSPAWRRRCASRRLLRRRRRCPCCLSREPATRSCWQAAMPRCRTSGALRAPNVQPLVWRVSHQDTQSAGGPAAIEWAARRFDGLPPVDTCSFGVPALVVPIANPCRGLEASRRSRGVAARWLPPRIRTSNTRTKTWGVADYTNGESPTHPRANRCARRWPPAAAREGTDPLATRILGGEPFPRVRSRAA